MIALNEKTAPYFRWIDAIRETKLAFTEEKVRRRGFFNIDDHGWIPWDEPIPFKATPNHPSGGCFGPKSIGENFKAWLEVHPVYIHPNSALAGAWVGFVPGLGGWRPEHHATHLQPLHEKYNIRAPGIGAMNHFGPDMRIGLSLGWGGLLKKIRYYRDLNRPVDPSFYEGEEALVLGIQSWIRKHVVKAREMANETEDAAVRENLLEIAEMNEWLVENPPRTLREACQFLAWFQSVDRMWAAGGALDQLDELLRPYYQADKSAGIIDDEAVIWCIASLFFNDTHYSQIGGPTPNGGDKTSEVSFLILEAMHRLKIPCNIAVRVHDNLNPTLLRRAVEYMLEDGTGADFSCSGGLDKGFAKNGFPLELAQMRAKVGCNWTALPGIEYSLQDVTRICLVAPFIIAFDEMTADPDAPKSLESLFERYAHHLGAVVDILKEGIDWHMKYQSKNSTEIVLNLFCHGTIERGLDAAEGGLDIYNFNIDGVGLATVADSFAAIERRVIDEKRLSWEELAKILKEDFAGAEDARLMLRNIDRFGSGGSRADEWALRVSKLYADLVKSKRTPNGYNVIPGMFSHGDITMLGERLGATPNGRHAHDPISHSSNPDPGFSREGSGSPAAKSNAVAAVQPGWGNSAPLQVDIDPTLARDDGGVDALIALIKGHNALGGTLINMNVISKEKILEAHADPSKYPDLVVRVTGYSAYFQTLSPEYRQHVVDRVLAES